MFNLNKKDIDFFKGILGEDKVLENEYMKKHTTFKIGGPARLMLLPCSTRQVSEIVKYCRSNNFDFFVIGNGSNLLVNDKGIEKVVIKIADNMAGCEVSGNAVRAGAGILLSSLSNSIVENSLTGFEFASGIPGTLGGGVFMNAGAYGGELKDVVKSVTAVDENGLVLEIDLSEMEFDYRMSSLQKKKLIVTEVELELNPGDKEEILTRIKELTVSRTTKQPLSLPSAGSTFKRPEGYFAGKLIEDSGLRGLSYKDAQVSQKHCGFIVNNGNSTYEDILTLIRIVQKTVFDKFNVMLEPEIRIIKEEVR